MTESATNPDISLGALDICVARALDKPSAPPFLGLLEFSDDDRTKARNSIIEIGKGNEREIERALRSHPNFTAWYLCDVVRRAYGTEGTPRVWPDIAEALGINSELNQPFRRMLHEIVAQRCQKLGLPIPSENMVSLFLLHAGVSEAQLLPLIRAFLTQERHIGMPNTDDGNALNEWEDTSLRFVPPSLKVLRMPIIWDVSAWHACVYAECRNNEFNTDYHTKFDELIKEAEKERGRGPPPGEYEARPRLILDNMELAIKVPDGTSRQRVQFDGDPPLRVRAGSSMPLPVPLPSRVSFGDGIPPISILSQPGEILVGDADIEGDVIQVRRHHTLSMTNIIIFAREPIHSRDDAEISSHEVAENLFTAQLTFQQDNTLELLIGEHKVDLKRQLYRRIRMKGGIIGKEQTAALHSPEATMLISTGIAIETQREISVRLNANSETIFPFQTDASGDAEIPLADILSELGEQTEPGPSVLRVELLRPRESENEPIMGGGVKMRADVWPEFLGYDGNLLKYSYPPHNLEIEDSRHISQSANTLCVDPEASSEPEIAFMLEGKLRRYRLPPPDPHIIHITPDGATRLFPIGSSLTLTSEARGGALRISSGDREAELEIPDRPPFKAFQGGRANTVSLRGLGLGWIKLHSKNQISTELVEIREAYSYHSVSIERRLENIQINVQLSGAIDALRIGIERETGEVEKGDIHFEKLEQFPVQPPSWAFVTQRQAGFLEISINEQKLSPGIWLGRLYVKSQSGWRAVVAQRGDILTFVSDHGAVEPETTDTAKRCMRVLGWLDLCHAPESWTKGGVDKILTSRKTSLVEYLDTIPSGRAILTNMSLNDDWYSASSTWMPEMHALLDCPQMFEGSITNFRSAGGVFEAFALLKNQRLRELDFIDPLAFLGFSNVVEAHNTGEKLTGFDMKKLMQIVSTQENNAQLRWDNKPVLGPTHWRAAHLSLQDRIEETHFFSDDAESNNGQRSLKLRHLHQATSNIHEKLPIPICISEDDKTIHEDSSRALQDFAVAIRSEKVLSWLSSLEKKSEISQKELLRSLGDLVRLAPELFAFHLIAAELAKGESNDGL